MPAKTRVTNAELARRIDSLTVEVEKLRDLLVNVAVLNTRQEEIVKDVERLEGRINTWGGLNSFGVVLAGVLGYFFGPRQ